LKLRKKKKRTRRASPPGAGGGGRPGERTPRISGEKRKKIEIEPAFRVEKKKKKKKRCFRPWKRWFLSARSKGQGAPLLEKKISFLERGEKKKRRFSQLLREKKRMHSVEGKKPAEGKRARHKRAKDKSPIRGPRLLEKVIVVEKGGNQKNPVKDCNGTAEALRGGGLPEVRLHQARRWKEGESLVFEKKRILITRPLFVGNAYLVRWSLKLKKKGPSATFGKKMAGKRRASCAGPGESLRREQRSKGLELGEKTEGPRPRTKAERLCSKRRKPG